MQYPTWRLVHVAIGVLLAFLLFVHTGFRAGDNLNGWLMACFVFALISGVGIGAVVATEHQLDQRLGRSLRSLSLWTHIAVLWPLPVLLGFHVLKTYYY